MQKRKESASLVKRGAQYIECHHKDIYIPLTPPCDLRQYADSNHKRMDSYPDSVIKGLASVG